MKDHSKRFAQIINDLLFLENDASGLLQSAREYCEFLSRITGIDPDSRDFAETSSTKLSGGKAISPVNAARCVLDQARTSCFLRGIYAASLAARERFPGERLEILYAGSGPFAALVLPLCAKFSPAEICFTLIDFHAVSLKSVEKLFRKLGFIDYLGGIIQTDASQYEPPDGRQFHLIITETMQRALDKEPQAAITFNLAKHLKKGGIFIPERVSVEACLADIGREFSLNSDVDSGRERVYLGRIAELSAGTGMIEPVTVEIPKGDFSSMQMLLLTKVAVFGSFELGDYESGITFPSVLWNLPALREGTRVEFTYQTGVDPHFEARIA